MHTNISSISFIFEAILISLLLILPISWGSIAFTKRIGLIDLPGSAPHKKHTSPVPMAGGIAFILSIIISGFIFDLYRDPVMSAIIITGGIVFLFGLWDDITDIPPIAKLGGQVFTAFVLIRLDVYVQIFESPEFFIRLPEGFALVMDWVVTVVWLVGITNAFNFVDSMDGLAVGLGGVAAAFFILLTLDSSQIILSTFSGLLFGICFGLYFLNSPPALLFLGDGGAQSLGFLLASLAIAYNPLGSFQTSSWLTPILLLGVPIFDVSLVVYSRYRRGKLIFSASRDHTYHRLISIGLNSNRAVMIMHLAALSLGCLAFLALTQSPLIANSIFIIIVFISILIGLFLDRQKGWLSKS